MKRTFKNRRAMKTKNIFKALALAMLVPAMLFSTACQKESTVQEEDIVKKGYELLVTINVTRQGDATTRASYNESTKKLEFSAGDKLFVCGFDADQGSGGGGSEPTDGRAGQFAGTLTWVSEGTFSGTIITENEYSGTIDDLFENEGFSAVFIGSGAGLPRFMNIPGEQALGVFSANEYLTRSNLMGAFSPDSRTPIMRAKKAVIVGGGNVAMDAARTAKRLGAEVHVVYRRSEAELPARAEEVHHAKEEGIIFDLLTNPVEIVADENGWVKGCTCIRMELGEPDASGRRSPVPVEGSEFTIECDAVIMSLGTSPNPLIKKTTSGLEVNKRGGIIVNESEMTSRDGVFAGGDAVTGAATVILAMGAGKAAAKGIDEYLSKQ